MLRSQVLLIVLSFGLTGVTRVAAAGEQSFLRVLCYNIHYGQGNDGKYDLKRIAAVISSADPDIVALQEVDVGVERSGRVHQLQELSKLTKLTVRYGPTQHYQGGLFGNAVMTRLPIGDVQIHPLPYTESSAKLTTYPRGAILVNVTMPNGRALSFISTHFQHNLPNDRIAEAKAINSLFGHGTTASVLAGDMNAIPDAEPIRILEASWQNAIGRERTPTAPSVSPRSRIDYVFYRGASLKLVHSAVIADSVASDHRPVLAVFEILQTAEE